MANILMTPPRENLVRALPGLEYVRAEGDQKSPKLTGQFAVFDQWALVDSQYEGLFMERFASGSLAKTLREGRDRIKCLLRHGEKFPSVGEAPIGRVVRLEEDSTVEVALYEGLPEIVLEGLRDGQYGWSFKFRVINAEYNARPPRSEHNPRGLPEKTVTEAYVVEFGPAPFPVYDGAAASLRSITDDVMRDQLRVDDRREPERQDDRAQSMGRTYDRAMQVVSDAVWAIHPDALATILGILGERAAGQRPTLEEIKERIGVRAQVAESEAKSPVAVIPISGPIIPHGGTFQEVSGATSIESLQERFREALANPDVGAILLNIDSPGGSGSLVPEFASEIYAARGQKPIVAMANTMAGSAAYWLASQADEIVVTPSGEVGSIGVYAAHEDISAAEEQAGVKTTLVSAGKYKVEKNPFEPLSEEGRADMQKRVDAVYSRFLAAVAKGRGVKVADVREQYGQGRMVLAEDAKANGMADRVATFDETYARLLKAATRKPSTTANGAASAQTVTAEGVTAGAADLQLGGDAFSVQLQEPTAPRLPSRPKRIEIIAEAEQEPAPAEPPAAVPEPEPSEATTPEQEEPEPSEATTPEQEPEDVGPPAPSDGPGEGATAMDTEAVERLTIEQVRERLDSIKTRFTEIHAEFGASVKPDAVNEEIDQLLGERERLEEAASDWERTARILESYANSEKHKDGGERTGRRIGTGGIHSNVDRHPGVPADIFSLAEYGRLNTADKLLGAMREGAKMALDRATFAHPDVDKQEAQSQVERMLETVDKRNGALAELILATGSPTYERAFGKTLMGEGLTPEEERAMSLTTTAGGFAVPYTLDPTVILTSNGVVNPLRQVSRIETITGNEWRGLSTDGITASYTAEATEASDANPVFAQPTLNVEKAQSFIPFSIEIGEDWGSLQTQAARLFADAKDGLEADKFLNGFGHASNVPQGLHTGATAIVSTAAATTFTLADLYSLTEGLAPRFEPNAKILGNIKQFNRVRAFDTAGGAGLWVQLRDSIPGVLVGYDAYRYSQMTSALTSGSTIFTFGDFSNFLIVDRIGMTVELIPHLFGGSNRFPTGQRGLYAYWRNSTKVLTYKAFVSLKVT